ncbi:MAG: hypothetical protein ACOY93_04470 [Bacillota bacterium]
MGTPMRLPAEVAGSLSRMQGLLQAAQPEIQSAFASHWLAARQAAAAPGFQQVTQNALLGLYGATALSGLLRCALSGRATPEVMGGIIDQVNLIQQAYQGATQALGDLLQDEQVRQLEGVRMMARNFTPLDAVYQNILPPAQTVVQGIRWSPAGTLPGFGIQRALIGSGTGAEAADGPIPGMG